jgi:NAD-dependent dihydropyrimidine dehydrogenase PreA subunit
MYNNSVTAIIEEMCDVKDFRFRHSLRFDVSEERLK